MKFKHFDLLYHYCDQRVYLYLEGTREGRFLLLGDMDGNKYRQKQSLRIVGFRNSEYTKFDVWGNMGNAWKNVFEELVL